MATPNREAIETFMSITGVDEALALRKLEEHGGDLNAAVNAHFSEGDTSIAHGTVTGPPQDDLMEIDDPINVAPTLPRRNPASLFSEATMNPFSLLDPQIRGGLFDSGPNVMNRPPFVSHPREVREIPIEVKDGGDGSNRSGNAPIIEDLTGTEPAHGPSAHGTVIIDDEDDDDIPTLQTTRTGRRTLIIDDEDDDDIPTVQTTRFGRTSEPAVVEDSTLESRVAPSAPRFDDLPDYGNDIEEEMIQAAIEASKRDVQETSHFEPQQRQSHAEDAELAEVVSLSLKTAEQEKALHEQKVNAGPSQRDSEPADTELEEIIAPNGRLERGGSSIQDEVEDLEEQPLVRHRSRRTSSMESGKEVGVLEPSPPSSPKQNDTGGQSQHNGDAFPAEWGGISSEEHDEAVMLEAAMFGGIPEGTGYHFAYAPHQFMQAESSYPRRAPRPPSPSLQAQRLIREQQDDEYLASLAADREKEMKAMEEAEARLLQEAAVKEAALQAERKKEEALHKKLAEEQEFERLLAAKEASLPNEPESNNENAVTLLVRMPDGSRRGRRFLKSDNLQSLFDYIDIGRAVKPGTYRLVRPFPRRAFGDAESSMTLSELGLTSKQEALYLELV